MDAMNPATQHRRAPRWRWERWTGAAAAALLWLAAGEPGRADDATGNTTAEYHTFTNTAGKTMQAKVTGLVDDMVYLRRSDGAKFKVRLNALSADDQAYATGAAVKLAQGGGSDLVQVSATRTKSKETMVGFQTNWDEGYEVQLKNQTAIHLVKPVVRYIFLVRARDNVGVAHQYRSQTLDNLPANAETSFETDKVRQTKIYKDSKGRTFVIQNQLLGLWVRIYTADNQLVQEWISSKEWLKTETWDVPDAQ